MGSITGSIGSNGSMTYFNAVRYLNCSCPAGYYPTQITFNDIKSGGAYWKNNSSSSKRLDIHLVKSDGTAVVVNIMRITLNANGTDSSTKTTSTFDASGYVGQGIYLIGGNATGNIYLQNGTSVTVTTAGVNYTLTTKVSPSGYGSVTAGGTIACGSTKSLTATPSTGRYFSSWSKTDGSLSSTTSNPTTFTMGAGNATVTANFGTSSYTLTVSKGTGISSVSGGGSKAYGSSNAISATASTGYTFKNWTSNNGGSFSNANSASTNFTMPAGNVTVTANANINSYTLTTAVSPSGSGSVTAGGSMNYNSSKSLTATPSTGYSFSSWSKTAGTLSSTTANPTTFTIGAGNATVTANFTIINYSITKSAGTGGSITAQATGTYGEVVSITATPDTGYQFDGWTTTGGTIASASSETTTLTMPASDVTITAAFSKINYSVNTSVYPAGSGTISSNVDTAQYGDTVTLSYTPTAGYELIDFTTEPEIEIENDQFSMPASNVSIIANFEQTAVPSIPSLSKKTFEGGEMIVLSIDSASSSLAHKYRLRFNDDMDTGWVSVAAGVTSVDLYIPIAWAMKTEGALIVTNGTLSLETYLDEALIGTETITSLRYKVLDDTFPKFVVWRCNQNGNKTLNGIYGKYSFTIPDGVDSCSITYDGNTVTSPANTGDILPNDKQEFTLDSNHIVTLSLTYGSETFTLSRDIPKVVSITKAF